MPSLLNETFVSQYHDANYSDYRTDVNCNIDEGLLILPVAGPPGTPPKIVRTHAPYATKRADWIAEKVNAKPNLPHWETGNKNDVLIHAHWKPMSPGFGLGYFVFSCHGSYSYVSAVAPDMENITLPMGAPPNVKRSATENTYTIGLFDKSILRTTGNKSF